MLRPSVQTYTNPTVLPVSIVIRILDPILSLVSFIPQPQAPINDCPEVTLHFQLANLNRRWTQFRRERPDELEANVAAQRRRWVGNMTFLCELFKLEMAEESIMHRCITTMLDRQEEAALECLCCLLSTIGSKLDCDKAKCHMDKHTRQMEQILKEEKTTSRIRFMVKDVMDLCQQQQQQQQQQPLHSERQQGTAPENPASAYSRQHRGRCPMEFRTERDSRMACRLPLDGERGSTD
ncbi:hypothetical protein SKAU_G00297820 [Synaphobranchus kaupii]|uniref:MIF4G domain-containing protein n=1 Tax=Synaphobranchus kaupii TaxID=118154 RepID=A0A9Q1EV39_SYNKA|nr:hypothetical protein SKAU_G00297820 [Synaphobranchus kaupii]